MKTKNLVIPFILFISSSFSLMSQNIKVEKYMSIFDKNSSPIFQNALNEKYSNLTKKEDINLAILSNVKVIELHKEIIAKEVIEESKKKELSKEQLITLIEKEYKSKFHDLPDSFYKQSEDEINKL